MIHQKQAHPLDAITIPKIYITSALVMKKVTIQSVIRFDVRSIIRLWDPAADIDPIKGVQIRVRMHVQITCRNKIKVTNDHQPVLKQYLNMPMLSFSAVHSPQRDNSFAPLPSPKTPKNLAPFQLRIWATLTAPHYTFPKMLRLVLLSFLVLSVSVPHAVRAQNQGCKCPDRSRNFEKQYYQAHIVVRAFVLRQHTSCHLCTKKTDRRNAIRIYTLYTYQTFRGKSPGQVFQAQAFENADYCGVRLKTRQTYMLNLANPNKISRASHWTPGWYVLDACQAHYNWGSLNRHQRSFLSSRLWCWYILEEEKEVQYLRSRRYGAACP